MSKFTNRVAVTTLGLIGFAAAAPAIASATTPEKDVVLSADQAQSVQLEEYSEVSAEEALGSGKDSFYYSDGTINPNSDYYQDHKDEWNEDFKDYAAETTSGAVKGGITGGPEGAVAGAFGGAASWMVKDILD